MTGWSRAVSILVGAGGAGLLLWLAAQIGRHSTGGYWAAYGIVAGAGLVLAVTQLRGRGGNPAATFVTAFLPVLIVAGWVLLALQPHPNWFRSHVLAWSGDVGIRDVVRDVGTWLGVLAFGIGFTFGVTLEPGLVARRRPAAVPQPAPATPGPHPYEPAAADEPTTAERTEAVRAGAAARDGATTGRAPTPR
jgi:hypothetical protein